MQDSKTFIKKSSILEEIMRRNDYLKASLTSLVLLYAQPSQVEQQDDFTQSRLESIRTLTNILAEQEDNRITVTLDSQRYPIVAQLLSNGSLDVRFGDYFVLSDTDANGTFSNGDTYRGMLNVRIPQTIDGIVKMKPANPLVVSTNSFGRESTHKVPAYIQLTNDSVLPSQVIDHVQAKYDAIVQTLIRTTQ